MGLYYPDDVMDLLMIYRYTGETLFCYLLDNLFDRGGIFCGYYLYQWDHGLSDRSIAKRKYLTDHNLLFGLDIGFLATHLYNHIQLLAGEEGCRLEVLLAYQPLDKGY